jgi:hypothetical protein
MLTNDEKAAFVEIYKAAYAADKQFRETQLEWMPVEALRYFIWNQKKSHILQHDHLESIARQVQWDLRGSVQGDESFYEYLDI